MLTALRFNSALPNTTMALVVEPAFGALRCKLIEQKGDKENTVVFVLASPGWLADEFALCLKANARHKGESIRVNFTWTNTNGGFNYYLSRADVEQLLAAVKEINHA